MTNCKFCGAFMYNQSTYGIEWWMPISGGYAYCPKCGKRNHFKNQALERAKLSISQMENKK